MGDEPAHFRRTAREPVELTVRFRRDAEDAALEHSGRLVDLGMGGAQVKCEQPPRVEERVRLVLSAPSAWDPLDLPAVVRWVEDATFGVAFGELSRPQASALYELLAASRFAGAAR